MSPVLFSTARPSSPRLSRRSTQILRSTAGFSAICLIAWYLVPLTSKLNVDAFAGPPPSVLILDRNGVPLDHLPRDDHYAHQPSPLEGIPTQLIDATLAAEDKRFYEHGGIDILANMRAIHDSIKAGRFVSGASTITQQTVKLTSDYPPRTFKNKLLEALSARHLEMRYNKDTILASYFNHLDYGNLTQGPRQAALHYFGKELSELSIAESALLAGLPQAPSRHNPRRNPNNAKKRRDWVLDRMQAVFDYPEETISLAKNEPIKLMPKNHCLKAPQLASLVLKKRRAQHHTVTTTIDATIQNQCQKILTRELSLLASKNAHNGAVVVIENKTRAVRAIIGSADYHSRESGQINAALVPRSPGSALKPFTYLLAFDSLKYSPSTIIADVPTQYAGTRGPDEFVNYDRNHRGPVSVYHALGNSLNVPAVRTLNAIGGPKPLVAHLQNIGISTINKSDQHYGLSLTLGSCETTLLELTNAYCSIAELGTHRPYQLISPHTATQKSRVSSPESTYLIASIMADNLARSANFGTHSSLRLPFKCAVKTGTSSDFRDNFCIGFTGDYTVGVWVGNLSNTPMKGVSGVSGAGPVFRDVMLSLHRQSMPRWLTQPEGLSKVTTDPHTGKRIDATHPRYSTAIHTFSKTSELPSKATFNDYSENGLVLLDDRFTQWIESSGTQKFISTKTQERNLELRVLSPAREATYLLDPDLPDRGAYLSLISNCPNETIWSCESLEITHTGKHPTLILQAGSHTVTAEHKQSGATRSIDFFVQEL